MSIEIRDLHKSFGSKHILKGFSLTVEEGETISIIGHSGAGKSVTLKTILGLIRPDRGEVWVDGKNVHALERDDLYELRRQVGYVFQFAALFDSMTIRENVAMGLRRIKTMTEGEIQHRVSACLYLVNLVGAEDRNPSELSGGMQKRAGLARAIATEPKYLLYDEPTTGLDPVTTTTIDELIKRMSDELSVTGIVVTHDMTSAYRISDRIAMLHEGSIRMIGTPDEIRSSDDPVVRGFVEGRPELMHREDGSSHPRPEAR
jgi:phospholipid/cholesterol/gamma-HCH transport system ATP-binding protein